MILDEKIKRASEAFDRGSRNSLVQEGKLSRPGSRISQHSIELDVSKEYRASMNEKAMSEITSEKGTLEDPSLESARLRDKEKLARWKAEREKVERERRQDDEIRERSQRENVMGIAKGNETKEKRRKKRVWCCGLFGL